MDASGTDPNALVAAAPPDWDAVAEEIRCPLCEYILRGLAEPRCPECGFRFAWPELLDPSRRLHPFIFEHNKGPRAFWRTLLAGWRPKRFWSRLHPAQPSRPRRMIRHWLLCALPIALSVLTGLATLVMEVAQANKAAQAGHRRWLSSPGGAEEFQWVVQQFGSVQKYLDAVAPTDPIPVLLFILRNAGFYLKVYVAVLTPLAWTWLTLASLQLFQISMQRAHIRTVHVLRCVIYASDVFFWAGLFLSVYMPVRGALFGLFGPGGIWALNVYVVVLLVAPIIASYRLASAYRHYLKFDHPAGTILASQIIALLIGLILFWAPWVWL